MKSDKIDLYCTQCDKNYVLDESQILWMMSNSDKVILYKKDNYRFVDGCFFKEFAMLQRKEKEQKALQP